MKKIYLLLVICSLVFSYQRATAQLSGVYTVGGISPDFPTLDTALSALMTQRANGKVVFDIRPGTYYIRYFGFFNVNDDTIIFESSTLDSSSVIIKSDQYIPIEMSGAEEIAFKEVTIIDSAGPFAEFDYETFQVENCCVLAYFNMSDLTNFEFKHDSINSPGLYQIISQAVDMENNVVYLLSGVSVSYSSSTIIKNNKLVGGLDVGYSDGANVIGNVSSGDFMILYSPNSLIIDNTISTTGFAVDYSNGCTISGNKIFASGINSVGDASSVFISDNFFSGSTQMLYSTGYYIYNNNFYPGPPDISGSDNFTIINNNFPGPVYSGLPDNTIHHNNYFPTGSLYDTAQTNFNPQYTSATDLHANNPRLSGTGIFLWNVRYDIDSVLRPNPPTIGANEICISKDTVTMFCGDSIPLVLCGLPDSGSFVWTPSTGLNSASIARPKASPSVSTLYHVYNSRAHFSDSVFIKVIPYQVQIYNGGFIDCGDSIYLFTNYNAAAKYHWAPSIGLSDTNSWHVIASPPGTITYTVTATVPGCGASYSTEKIVVDSLPTISIYYNIDSCLKASFINQTTCASSYSWNFGDSTTSTADSPSHVYDSAGDYYVTFIACNSSGCDTFKGYVGVYCIPTGVKQIEAEDFDLVCYPNPTTGKLTVTYNLPQQVSRVQMKVIDIYNREVLNDNLPGTSGKHEQYLDLSAESTGVYFLIFDAGDTRVSRKIVIMK